MNISDFFQIQIYMTNMNGHIPLKDFFKNPEKVSYRISPDGKYFSYLEPYEKRLNIFIRDVESGDIKRLTSETDRDISAYFWGNDNVLLYLKDDKGDENFKLHSIDIGDKVVKNLTPFDEVTTQIVDEL